MSGTTTKKNPLNLMLNVHSIFTTFSGEQGATIGQGEFCAVLRLQGCNMRCSWCDTPGTQSEEINQALSVATIVYQLGHIAHLHKLKLLITGGEPLTQPEGVYALIAVLLDHGATVQVETNGSLLFDMCRLYPYVGNAGSLRTVCTQHRLGIVYDIKYDYLDRMKPTQGLLLAMSVHSRYDAHFKHVCGDVDKQLGQIISAARLIEEHALEWPKIRITQGITLLNPSSIDRVISTFDELFKTGKLPCTPINVQIHKVLNIA